MNAARLLTLSAAFLNAGAHAQAVYLAVPVPAGREPDTGGRTAYDMEWRTLDGGAGRMSGGDLRLDGTAGQPDAGGMTDGALTLAGGFWMTLSPALGCYANCDHSTTPPALNVLDFSCFINSFAAADPYANCDGSTTPPTLNILDFNCFLNQFAAGCP